jgi:hypothetical protein
MGPISARQKKPFQNISISGAFGLNDDSAVRGVVLPVAGRAYYASLRDGRWRYWIRRRDDGAEGESFSDAVGSLLPLRSRDYMTRLNDHATGSVRPRLFMGAKGDAFVYDLEDSLVVERFALACVVADALSEAEKVLSVRHGEYGERSESAKVVQDALPNFNTNLSLWAVDAPSQSLILLPNAVVLRRDRYQWVVPYNEVAVRFEHLVHDANEATPGDVKLDESGTRVVSGEVRLALSDQRVKLQVSNPACAKRAADAFERLISFEPRRSSQDPDSPAPRKKKPRRKKKAPARGRHQGRRRSNASCGQIVVRDKSEDVKISIQAKGERSKARDPMAEDRIVIRVRLGADAGPPPPPEPEDGLATPEGVEDESDLGLVFSDECPLSEEPEAEPPLPGAGGDLSGLKLTDECPMADRSAAEVAAQEAADARANQIRGAVGALLAYVAKSDQGFSELERRVIRQALQLPTAFHLDGSFSAIRPGSPALQSAYRRLRGADEALRKRIFSECERVAQADDQVTRGEHQRLSEIKRALGV